MQEPNNRPHTGAPEVVPVQATQESASAEWKSVDRRTWQIQCSPDKIVLRSGETTLEIPSQRWASDVYVSAHGDSYVVRFETFDQSVGFLVPTTSATPVIRRLTSLTQAPPIRSEVSAPDFAPLLFPKVSPYAVWAVICSAIAFIPIVGLVPACIAVTLMVLHRKRVRRSRAYHHSRILCVVAGAQVAIGLAVNALSANQLVENWQRAAGGPQSPILTRPLRSSTTAADPSQPVSERAETGFASSPHLAQLGSSDQHNWALIVAGIFVVLLSLTVHEAAHAITAWWLGDDFARRLGRVTLNPIAHIDPIGTILLPLLLSMAGAGVFGWAKPVPVRLDHVARPRRAQILIALAGPGSNLLLAAVSLMLLLGIAGVVRHLAPGGDLKGLTNPSLQTTVSATGFFLAPLVGPFCMFLKLSFAINVLLAFFNLIPVPPLDGSWVLQYLFPRTLGPIYERLRPMAFLLFLGLLYTDVLDYLLLPGLMVEALGFLLVHVCTIY